MFFLTDDFNVRVGEQEQQTSGNLVNLYALDRVNENGQLLAYFCFSLINTSNDMDASKKQNMSHAKLYIVNFFFKNSH
jgi:hypothetical protein